MRVSEMIHYNPGLCPLCGAKVEMALDKNSDGGWICYIRCLSPFCRIALVCHGDIPDQAYTKVVELWETKMSFGPPPIGTMNSMHFLIGVAEQAKEFISDNPNFHRVLDEHVETLRVYLKNVKESKIVWNANT